MLRLAVIALLLANAGYYAYTQGWLRSAGLVTPEQAEPQRRVRYCGNATAAKIPIIATTIISSIRVKPFCIVRFINHSLES